MECQTNCFTNSPYVIPPTSIYTSYNTPPHSLIWNSWPEAIHQTFSMNEDVLQMQQQLRFPTPPNTPPRGYSNITGEFAYAQALQDSPTSQSKTQQQRTQSVIMKIGHDQTPQHLPADDPSHIKAELLQRDFPHHDQQHLQSYNDTPSSGNSSPTSHSEFVCDWIDCGRYFESLELLAHHVTLIHAVASLSDGLYYCKWMGCQRTERGFNARYKMLVHVRTHTKEKPHQCHLCDKRFSRAENLKIHIRSHSGEKPYICNFQGCNKAYSNSSDRFKHTRTHSMEKPYMCKVPGCEKRYTDPSSLRKHVKTFKHTLHILSNKTSTEVPQKQNFKDSENYASCPPIGPTQKNCSHITLQNRSSSATQDSFCMDMEELCHIEATFNYYPATAPTPGDTEPSYWLKESETKNTLHRIHTLTYQQASNYNMQTDLPADKPLDLRVKRS